MTDVKISADRPVTILVVEDEPMILVELAFAIEDLGAVAVTATSAERAIETLEERTVDAAVLDFNLGRGKTCQPVSDWLTAHGVPFVLHSGDLMRQGEVIQNMGVEVIPKPSDSRSVARRVVGLVTQKAAQ